MDSMHRLLRTRTAVATIAGLSVAGSLAGCAASTSSAGTGAVANASTKYTDGTYTADGSYSSPGGEEEIAVTLTVKSNLVTAVKVTTVKADPTAAQYEQMFAGGISAVAVGKPLATLSVGTVAGSSLTTQGFTTALNDIRTKAQK
jgi:uncharacterized protein with FMN-binding domain